MNMAISLISSLVIVYIRIWIINTIFSDKKIKIHLTLKVTVIWLLLVSGLFFYKYILEYFGRADWYFLQSMDWMNIGLFVLYCTAFVLLLTLFLKGWYQKVLQAILAGALFFVALAYGSWIAGINTLIIYILISAYAEEYLKFSSGNTLFSKEWWTNIRDLIFFCILIGLGFSMVENIFYIVYNFINKESVSLVNLTLWRWLISTLLHIVSTGLIAYLTLLIHRKRNLAISLLGWIIAGFGIHAIYNLSLQYQLQYISIPLVIGWFFLLSYMLYQSDILYENG